MRPYQLVSAAWIVLTAPISAAEEETDRYKLPGGEVIVLSVDQQPGPDFCTLTLVPERGPPIPFWSRKSGEVIEWNDFPGGIGAADKKGDDVAVALGYDDFTILFVQVNLLNKTETVTVVPTGELYLERGVAGRAVVSVTAPNQLAFTHEFTKKTRVLLWREDGKPYLDGVVHPHAKRAAETPKAIEREPGTGAPRKKPIFPGTQKPASAPWAERSATPERTEGPDWRQSLWRVSLGVIGLLLIGAGVYKVIKRFRQR